MAKEIVLRALEELRPEARTAGLNVRISHEIISRVAGQMQQPEFDFSLNVSAAGYDRWRANREALMKDLACRMHLPLGHLVEVWLIGGVRLRGRLRLQDEVLIVEEGHEQRLNLQVDGVPFTYGELESCIRTD